MQTHSNALLFSLGWYGCNLSLTSEITTKTAGYRRRKHPFFPHSLPMKYALITKYESMCLWLCLVFLLAGSQHLIPHTSASSLSICSEAELICMQRTWSSAATGRAQAGLDLTAPQRQWQVNRHFTRVYTVIYGSPPSVKEVAKSAFNLAQAGCPLLFSVVSSNTVKLQQVGRKSRKNIMRFLLFYKRGNMEDLLWLACVVALYNKVVRRHLRPSGPSES